MVTLRVAEEDANVPDKVAVAVEPLPTSGLTVRVTIVPTGIFVAEISTEMGFAVSVGNVTSGVDNDPVGVAGTATPPICVIESVGISAGTTSEGRPEVYPGVVPAVLVTV